MNTSNLWFRSILIFGIFSIGSSVLAEINHPEKIGVGTWEFEASDRPVQNIESLGFKWYYDWRLDPLRSLTNLTRKVPFVPMHWNAQNLSGTFPTTTALLSFNEPDNATQGNMTVEQAIAAWPQLMAKNVRLGSPAPTTEQALSSTSWLGRFMAQAKSRGYRVDFIALHYYSADKSVAAFKTYLENAYAIYQKPIWVTEWALVDWNNTSRFTKEDTAAFANAALEMLDDLPFVERHAYFATYKYDTYGAGLNVELFDSSNNLTPAGEVFRKALLTTTSPLPPPPSQDTHKPLIGSVTPPSGSSIPRRSKVTLAAVATDNIGVTSVLFFVNGKKICTDSTAPYKCSWTAPKTAGSHKLEIRAYDAAGNMGSSGYLVLTVY